MKFFYPNHSMAMHGESSENHENDSFQILKDTDGRGKERDWKGKKKRSLLMAEHHAEVEELAKKAERMYDCGNYLVFKMANGRLKLY